VNESQVKSRKEADEILSEFEKDISVRQFLLTNFVQAGGNETHGRFRLPLDIIRESIPTLGDFPIEPPPEEGSRTWEGKTLFIKGEKSKYINKHNLVMAEKFFPGMQLKSLDTGHWVHAEQPRQFLRAVQSFVQDGTLPVES
jgi:pimeloyl-ACP methyl ester carboxylesterase